MFVIRKYSKIAIALSLPVAVALVAMRRPVAAASPIGQQPAHASPVRDGSHDFDFEYGRWRMPNQRLVKRRAGSHQWDAFVTCDEGSPLPGGIGGIDEMHSTYWPDFAGVTIRTYDPKTGLWRIYWVDNHFSGGVIEPPVIGRFDGSVGTFIGSDSLDGKPVVVRFIWKLNPPGSPIVATWEQAFSPDSGRTWETNWKNALIHDDHCTPTGHPTSG